MARPRQFDEAEAVEKAMGLFRRQGFKATSLADLTKAMGLSRSSFYKTFGSKRELFLTTLVSFDQTSAIYNIEASDPAAPAKAILAQVFARDIVSVIEGKGGCMFGSCAVEFSTRDSGVSEQVKQGIQRLEKMFLKTIEQGQEKGDVPSDKDAKAIAASLVATFYGIQTMTKAGLELDALKQVISQTLRQLG